MTAESFLELKADLDSVKRQYIGNISGPEKIYLLWIYRQYIGTDCTRSAGKFLKVASTNFMSQMQVQPKYINTVFEHVYINTCFVSLPLSFYHCMFFDIVDKNDEPCWWLWRKDTQLRCQRWNDISGILQLQSIIWCSERLRGPFKTQLWLCHQWKER